MDAARRLDSRFLFACRCGFFAAYLSVAEVFFSCVCVRRAVRRKSSISGRLILRRRASVGHRVKDRQDRKN